ncbi:hypothetical protein KP509_1Z194000 [Ceratopteris richardii]|nr:hypothetical protein KP509_1Z194000 [Ceratopteris richardii]
MGQKKRSASVRAVLTSNGSVSSTGSVIQEGAILSPSNDVEPRSNDSESACKSSGGLQMTGELVLSQENSELVRSTGGSETGRTFLEEVPSVKTECEKALVALRRGNSTKALKLIRDACSRHESNALVQRVRGHICMRLASMIEDLTTKQRHLKEAIEAAHKAVLLSPRSVEYSQFHAQLLFEAATDSKGFEEVVQECRRALEIEDPIDPAKESLHEEGHHKLPTAEARIAQVQQELQNLIQKANIASISNWMKALGNGSGSEEKLRFIHMRKLVDDPMEQRIFQPKRPHEVKKSIKTPEEKRKDIEVRVAAARLLQQKRDCSPPHSDDGNANLQKGSTRQERRKTGNLNARKSNQVQNHDDIMERLKPYWSSLSSSERERMLEVGVDALKQHYNSPKASFASDLLNEALQFALKHKTWRFWVCCSCEERFKDCQEHAEHVMHKHIESLSTKSRRLLPHEIDHDLAEQLLIEDCQPFDGPAAIRLLINACHLGSEEANIATDPCPVVEMNGFHHLVKANATSIETIVEFSGDSSENNNVVREPWLNPNDVRKENESANGVCNGNCHVSKKILQIGKDFRRNELPLVDDEERSKLLQKIFSLFRILIRNKCLASDHMEKIVQYALDELQNFIPDTSIHYEFNHSPVYIRFLPAPQLRRIFNYLHELVNACGLDHPSDNGAPSAGSSIKEDAIYDRLFLNEDFTSLILDEKLLKGIYDSNTAKQVSSSYEIDLQSASQHEAKDGQAFTLSNLQLSWIYQKTDYEFQPVGWKQHFDSCIQQGREVLQALQKEFDSLQNFCDRKCEHLRYEEAVIMAETLCIEELKKRELKADGSFLGHETVLRRQQQEILDNHATGLTSQQKLELEVIKSILREAQTINLPQFPYHNAISVASARLSDSEDEEEDPWRVPDLVPQLDPCIEVAIQRHKERCTSEINKLDARILRSMDSVQRLELKLGALSALDYRAVVLPLVKSFLKAQLEEAAEKDALLKSDAARDAFLAELSQHERNMNERYSDSGRHVKEKVKEKKKNREHRKLKDGKRTQGPGLSIQKASEIG